MKYTTLPHTDIKVSKICLGTMTFGNQNTQEEGFKQMDYALDQGVNFFDTAEMYPVPAQKETYAETERIIGKWLKQSGKRSDIVLGSKIAGTGDYTAHIRTNGFAPIAIEDAIDQSLKRLQTDYLDLFQLHWPERQSNFFGTRDYKHNPDDPWIDNFNEVLESLDKAIKAGKIRNIGISNEKAWGAMRYIEESKYNNRPRMVTIQNAYSLINRGFESDLAEIAMREGLGLLAYSPMAFGVLSGKYVEGLAGDDARLNLFPRFSRYSSVNCTKATTQYLKIAADNGLSLAQMSLAFVTQQPFVTSNIIGASKMDQLKENIDSIHLHLSDEIIAKINKVHEDIPNPAT
ncbi:aldo/keto reductase [Formosa algae]|uniref:Protein tas n=1 Tax=Formosa algae TaxID=225843 RepID=A0A9X0YKH0_9FLAO|nr:aldo/keto reductase [Formosa algae]MBP1840264.1 aryl-alcohol dehydrogenase-like predicted oxidoreductase [Formosa algae]MDQ0334128.1 aryl-alcohol dehydrogenase-like predicted oxidoreductase [Formosa algae]OEI79453.1 aldo/keto reductase [Formosa algae]